MPDDLEQLAADLLLAEPDGPPGEPKRGAPQPTPPHTCPECGEPVARIPESGGMWSGCKASGGIAGGAWWCAECGRCGARLQAYWDVFGEDAEVIQFPNEYEPELVWSRSRD
ncbi:MAG: hypothetical protein FJ271_08370 [Planctomycetes bacterium]|nr:hypothetical protein [Planctomycetota bacterium]